VFETLLVEQGVPRFWQRHMTRLLAGCRRLAISDIDSHTLYEEARALLAGDERCILKIIITRGAGGRGYGPGGCGQPTRILQRHATTDYPEAYSREGVRVRLCESRLSHNPRLAGIKHLNRLEQVLARSEWDDPDIQEGLVFDGDGRLVEGTMSNVFLTIGGRLYTPDLSRCGVAGIMRSIVLELAGQLGQLVQHMAVSADDLAQAEEVFLTNSLIGIWPVRQIDARDYPVGLVTRQLQTALAGLVEEGTDWMSDEIKGGPDD
jgi:4-amino-4-deoxychorismate lyase